MSQPGTILQIYRLQVQGTKDFSLILSCIKFNKTGSFITVHKNCHVKFASISAWMSNEKNGFYSPEIPTSDSLHWNCVRNYAMYIDIN